MTSASDLKPDQTVVFFDGECNLCNGSVNFLIDHDPEKKLLFASLQSPVATQLLQPFPDVRPSDLDSVVALHNGKALQRSSAVLHIASQLSKPWSLAVVFRAVPVFVRDSAYKLVAKNRKRLVRKPHSCRMPDPDRLSRFLD